MIWNNLFWIFGVGTCAYYAYETLTVCAQTSYLAVLFSPLFLIPLANLLLLSIPKSKTPGKKILAVLGTLNGLAIIVSSILVTVLSPLCMMACLGFAIGLVMLFTPSAYQYQQWAIAPICAFYFCVATGPIITSVAMRAKLRRFLQPGERGPWFSSGTCFALILSTLLVSIFPTALTNTCLAAVNSGTKAPEGLLLLRAVGDESTILRACYNESAALPWFFGGSSSFFLDDTPHLTPSMAARETYYRVKGKPFNTVPRPMGTTPDWDVDYYINYLDWAGDFAGDAVGGVVQGLSLTKSEISGYIDSNEAVSHMAWKMHFHNAQTAGTELRAQILLPPHAVVTGCSLWLNGKKCDAIIATRESTRQAYEKSAQRGGKPLMVSTAGAGRVLLQSATGTWGRDAELLVEITSPLELLARDRAALPLPMFTERNFSVGTAHTVSLNTNQLVLSSGGLQVDNKVVQGRISNDKLGNGISVVLQRNSADREVTAPEQGTAQSVIVQRIVSKRLSAQTPTVVVIDGSASMSAALPAITTALRSLDCRHVSLVWGADKPLTVIKDTDSKSPEWKMALDKVLDSSCVGGQNNAEALQQAMAAKFGGDSATNFIWLHGPQPVNFSHGLLNNSVALQNGDTKLYEYQVCPGPNEVVRSLDQSNIMIQVPRIFPSIEEDLSKLCERLSGAIDTVEIHRQKSTNGSSGSGSNSTNQSQHAADIAQLYIADMVLHSLSRPQERLSMGVAAEKHHLVTPYTSALVLESQLQYKELGVESHTAMAKAAAAKGLALPGLDGLIPATPEPPMALIMVCVLLSGATFVWIRRRRQTAESVNLRT